LTTAVQFFIFIAVSDRNSCFFTEEKYIMWKNMALIAYTVIVCVFAVLWLAGKIDWVSNRPMENLASFEQKIAKASEILKPQVLEMKDVQLLCLPSYHGDGTNYKFEYRFFIYENGNLKSVNYTNE
jgi:predicted membrane protein